MERSEAAEGRKRTSIYLEYVRAGARGINTEAVARRLHLDIEIVRDHVEALSAQGKLEPAPGDAGTWRAT